jgi:hypothetical protein
MVFNLFLILFLISTPTNFVGVYKIYFIELTNFIIFIIFISYLKIRLKYTAIYLEYNPSQILNDFSTSCHYKEVH